MLSRATRISLLLAIDVVFFFIELIAGYAVGSLALVADSFHMLNDVMSLIVALYAIKLSKSQASSQYSYGWHRAEIVAALINGVFLLALCFSILMEAIERFFNTSSVKNPKLVVVVGSFGLVSNFLGLLLFRGQHSHSHGHSAKSKPSAESRPSLPAPDREATSSSVSPPSSPIEIQRREREDSFSSLYGHPAATRASLVQAAQDIGYGRPTSPTPAENNGPGKRKSGDVLIDIEEESGQTTAPQPTNAEIPTKSTRDPPSAEPTQNGHEPQRPSQPAAGGQAPDHSHGGSMNMHALILHVLGDALGNVGVIATGLVIWFSTWQYKYYFDPFISLVITVIIFSSAMPLVRSASFILLQAVPSTISLESIRQSIQRVSGVLSVHELHVWQLSESKIIASVHVWVSRKREYMHIARDIRRILHEHGVHSSTIQPEFHTSQNASEEHLITDQETPCLIACPPDQECAPENACCPPQKPLSPPLVDV